MAMRFLRGAAALAATLACTVATAEPKLTASAPTFAYGEPVRLQLDADNQRVYLPATHYLRRGASIWAGYEATRSAASYWTADFALPPVLDVGELPPGSYRATAEVIQLDATTATDRNYASTTVTVLPPKDPGLYTVPRSPDAGTPTQLVIVSLTPVIESSVRVAVGNGVVRVDYDYLPYVATAHSVVVVNMPVMAAGSYTLEGWGTPINGGGAAIRYFGGAVEVKSLVTVTEFYQPDLDHYFMTARSEDVALLDSGTFGRWDRTSQRFRAWSTPDAAAGVRPVCRFWAAKNGAHYFTIDAAECEQIKALEKQGKAEAAASKAVYTGFQYEGTAFYAVAPVEGRCPASLSAVSRFSRLDAKSGAMDYRFTSSFEQYAAMAASWKHEGAAFCVPSWVA